jgi:predicted HicB family RNase H-like nuclease
MDFMTKSDIENSFSRIEILLNCGIFLPKNSQNPLVQSALAELLIRVRDLMYKSEKYAVAIKFDDDINITEKVKNVSDAIKFIRDAICHIDSDNHNYNECRARISYNIMYGKGTFMKIEDIELKSEYDDDICFFFGSQKLYLKRHICRAYQEAKVNLKPKLENL